MNSLLFWRFIGMSIIFVHHLIFFGEGVGFTVSFFFVLSGFTLSYFYGDKFKKFDISSMKVFYKKRMKKLYVIHLFSFFLMVFLFYIVKYPFPSYGVTLTNILLLQSFWFNSTDVFAYNGVSWFLSTLIFLYFTTPFLIRMITKSTMKSLLLLLLLIYCSGVIMQITLCDGFQELDFKWYLLYISPYLRIFDYFLGVILGRILFLFLNSSNYILLKNLWIATLVEVLSITLCVLSIKHSLYPMNFLNNQEVFVYDLYAVPAILLLIFIFSTQYGILAKLLDNKVFRYLGKISFSFFMIHQVLIAYFANFFPCQFTVYNIVLLYIITISLADGVHKILKF